MHYLRLYRTSFQNRISMPKRKNCICQALEFASRQNPKKIASKRSAETELQNTIELRATASEIVAPKPDLDARAKKKYFETLFKRIFRRKITSAKVEKICWQITVAAFMQPLQDDLRDPAAKDNSITNAATARSNLDAAITMRSAETELQNTLELRATASEIVAPKPEDLDARAKKKHILKHFLKGFLEGKSLAPKWRKSADKYCGSLHAATPRRFTRSSCKRQ